MACLMMSCFKNTEAERRSGNKERFGPREYSYAKLADATDKFSNENLLGEGGYGQVYQGSLDGKVVAIKKLKHLPDEPSNEGLEQEINVVSSVSHKNLVKLVGYCIEGANRLLVLEYVPQKSLKILLRGNNILEWKERMKIAKGSAKGLEYLHEDCKPKIIHRDVKADNILLDDNFEPKVADFGLALFFPETGSRTHISRSNKGTEVYADPENSPSQRVSEKSDVYSYGVVLLELITGRETKLEGTDIVTWAKSRIEDALDSGDYSNLVDSRLQKNYVEQELRIMISCAAACVSKPSKSRPLMQQIVRAFEGYLPIKDIWDEKNDSKFLNNNPKPNETHNVDEFQHMVPKPLVNSEANNATESKEFTHPELKMTTNGSSNTTNDTKRFRAYFQDDYKPKRYSYQELTTATGGFSEDNRLDEGPLGSVYKGDLDGEKVTVKKFKYNPEEKDDEYKRMNDIGRLLHHINVVNLIGYCEEGTNRLLVYEFVPVGKSLRSYLYDDPSSTLDLGTRIGISLNAFECVNYLFERDIYWLNPCSDWMDNFLLDDDFQPKLAEHGREKFFANFATHKSTSYIAPEYHSSRMFTQKTCVYSCGSMLLEMITGKERVDDIVQWVPQLKKAWENGNYDFVDKRLKEYNKIEMDRMIVCALASLQDNPQDRPDLDEIIELLKGNIEPQDFYRKGTTTKLRTLNHM